MNIKLYIIFLCSWFLSLGMLDAQWVQEKCPSKNNLNAISVIDSSSCWIVGDKGTILNKNKGFWQEYQNPATEDLYSISMISRDDGWAVGAKGTILHFDGRNWKTINIPTKKNLNSVYFKDSDNGIVVGELGTIAIYMNGIWNVFTNKIRADLQTASFRDEDVWIGGGLECVNVPIMKIDYKGGMYSTRNYNSFASVNSVYFLDSYNGWAVGSPSTILHFNGFGWEKPLIEDKFSTLKSVYFADESTGLSVGFDGTILTFSDNKWTREHSPTCQNLKAAAIIGKEYYAVGDSGTILLKKMDVNNIYSATDEHVTDKIEIFPNPCNDILNIKFSLESPETTIKISVTSTAGQVIMQKNINVWKGNLTYSLITSEFKNGLYNLRATIENKPVTAKFIVMH